MPVADDDVKVTVPPHCVIGPAGVIVGVAGNGLTVTVVIADVALQPKPLVTVTV